MNDNFPNLLPDSYERYTKIVKNGVRRHYPSYFNNLNKEQRRFVTYFIQWSILCGDKVSVTIERLTKAIYRCHDMAARRGDARIPMDYMLDVDDEG